MTATNDGYLLQVRDLHKEFPIRGGVRAPPSFVRHGPGQAADGWPEEVA